MPAQYIFTIENLSKAYGKKEVLKNIWLSFYPGAKIGVIGGNGSGKSTLLRIMAGIETDFIGSARPARGIRIGYLPQEPMLDPDARRPRQRRDRPSRRSAAHLARFDEINARLGEGPDADEMDATARRAGQGSGRHRGSRGLGPRPPHRDRHGRHAPAPRRRRTSAPSPAANAGASPSARSCWNGPTSCCSTSRPTTSTPKASPGWNGTSQEYPGTVVLVTHDRYFLDNVAKWILELDRGQGIPWEGNYSSWLEQKQARLALEEKQESSRRKQLARELEWVRMSPRARVAKNRARLAARTSSSPARTPTGAKRPSCLQIPPGPHLGTLVVEAEDLAKAYGDNLSVRGHELPAAARRHRRRHRPQRRRQDHALPHDRRRRRSPTAAPFASATRW